MAKPPFKSFETFRAQHPLSLDHHSSRVIHSGRRKQDAYDGTVSPAVLSFGSVAVGDESSTQTAVVTNVGYKPLPILSVTGVGDYAVNTDCPAILEPGATCMVTAKFVPRTGGAATGGIYVNTGDAAGTEFVSLMGVGIAPDVPVDPTADFSLSTTLLAFGNQQIATASAARSLVITNHSSAAKLITAITVPAGWTVTSGALPLVVPANGTVSLSVVFNPATIGAKSGTLTIVSAGTTGQKTVSLTGTGVTSILPIISISDGILEAYTPEANVGASPSSLLFSPTTVGTASPPMNLVLTNTGALPATVLSRAATGVFSFTVDSPEVGTIIPPDGGTAVFKVVFSPIGSGEASGTVSITTDAFEGSSFSILSAGTGAEEVPEPSLLPRLKIVGNQMVSVENDVPVRLKSVNWFGAEGENYTPHGTWAVTWKSIIDDIKSMGFNCIRLPFSGDMTTVGRTPPPTAFEEVLNADLLGKTSLEIFDMILDYCFEQKLYVVLDHHRRNAGQGADGSPIGTDYTQTNWLSSWSVMANRYKDHPSVVGADVHNEPHDHSWSAWATLAENCGNHILGIAPKWLIFVEGVGDNPDATSYWWGGALKGVATRPVVLTVPNKVVYSPHEYGQSVGNQAWLRTESNPSLPANYPNNLYEIWDANWGFIFKDGIAPLWIGEFGGHFGVDGTGGNTKPNATYESQWATNLVKYLNGDFDGDGDSEITSIGVGLSFAYWSYNPNSGDTGGLVRDDWVTHQTNKLTLLAPLLA